MKDYDIWVTVAEYVPAHPSTFRRLAQVSRTFYKIFMSDKIWERLNFYNVKRHIAEHYLAKASVYTSEERELIRSVKDDKHPGSNELYLAYILCANHSTVSTDPSKINVWHGGVRRALISEFGLLNLGHNEDKANADTVKAAILASPQAYAYASKEIKARPEIARLALALRPENFELVPDALKQTPEIARLALELRPENFELIPDTLKQTPEIACLAIKIDPRNFRLLSKESQDNEEIYRAQVRNLRGGVDHLELK